MHTSYKVPKTLKGIQTISIGTLVHGNEVAGLIHIFQGKRQLDDIHSRFRVDGRRGILKICLPIQSLDEYPEVYYPNTPS